MAQPPNTNDAFLREIDDEINYDRWLGLARRYGRLIIVALVLALVALAAWLWWQNHQLAVAGTQGEQYAAALKDVTAGQITGVDAKLAPLAKDGNEGYRASAKMLSASIALKRGDTKAAIASFKAIADDASLDQTWRDSALLRQTIAEYDTLAPDAVIARLKPLAVPGNPWFGTAGEMVGMAYIKQNKPALAGNLFAEIAKEPGMPDSLVGRAKQIASSLGVDAPAPTIKE